MSRDCPDRPPVQCRSCGEDGHMAKDCPNKKCANCQDTGESTSEFILLT